MVRLNDVRRLEESNIFQEQMSRVKSGASDDGQSGLMSFTNGFSKNCSMEVSFGCQSLEKNPLDFKAPFILGLPKIQLTHLIGKNKMNSAQNPCDIPWAVLPGSLVVK